MSDLKPSASKQILPFSVLSDNRTRPFTFEMELATIFALAELRRDKGNGLLSKGEVENIAFISKIGYPLWLIPIFDKPLLFDGLNRFKHTVCYAKIPDVKLFIDNLKRSSNTYETHLAFLSENVNYFEKSIEEKEKVINSLISDSDFLQEFGSSYSDGEVIEDESFIGLLPQMIENAEISLGLEELDGIYKYAKENKERLSRCMKLIKEINSKHIEYLKSVIGETKYKFKEMIKREEDRVNPQIIALRKDYDYQTLKITQNFQRQELPIYKEKIRLEKSIKLDQTKIDNCKIQAQRSAEKNDKIGEEKWKEIRRQTKKILSENLKKLNEIEKNIEILTQRKNLAISKLRSDVEIKIRELQNKILDLETSSEAKVMGYNQDIEKLKKNSEIIIDQLGRFIKIEETDLNELSNLGLKRNSELRNSMLFYIPFYIICYQTKAKTQYKIIPPSIVNTVCLSIKLKSFGRSQLKQLLSNRFYAITSLMDELYDLIEKNHMFKMEIDEIGEKFNLLKNDSSNNRIKKGLSDLKKEGWISQKEYQNIIPK